MTMRPRWWWCFLLVGCTGTETGNPVAVQVSLTAHSTDPAVTLDDSSADGMTATHVWVSTTRLSFFALEACEDPTAEEAAVEGPVVTDLLSEPPRGAFEPTAEHYCRARVELGPAAAPLPEGAPEHLLGSSVVVEGHRADGVPFMVATDVTPTLDLRAGPDGFALAPGDALLVAFDLATWLLPLDLDTADPDDEGTVTVTPDADAHRHDVFESHLPEGASLHRDADGSGTVPPDDEPLGSHHDP